MRGGFPGETGRLGVCALLQELLDELAGLLDAVDVVAVDGKVEGRELGPRVHHVCVRAVVQELDADLGVVEVGGDGERGEVVLVDEVGVDDEGQLHEHLDALEVVEGAKVVQDRPRGRGDQVLDLQEVGRPPKHVQESLQQRFDVFEED